MTTTNRRIALLTGASIAALGLLAPRWPTPCIGGPAAQWRRRGFYSGEINNPRPQLMRSSFATSPYRRPRSFYGDKEFDRRVSL